MLKPVLIFGRYKEIWCGIAIGVSTWMLDAMMHASLHGRFTWRGLTSEIIASDGAQLLFRALFVVVAVAFGVSLWRSNKRKYQMHDLRAAVDSLYRQIANPLLLIVGYSQMLSLKEGWPVGREAVDILKEIQLNARKIDEVIKHLPPPGSPLPEEAIAWPGAAQTWQVAVEDETHWQGPARSVALKVEKNAGRA